MNIFNHNIFYIFVYTIEMDQKETKKTCQWQCEKNMVPRLAQIQVNSFLKCKPGRDQPAAASRMRDSFAVWTRRGEHLLLWLQREDCAACECFGMGVGPTAAPAAR